MIRPGPFLLGCCALLAAGPLGAAPPTSAEMARRIDGHLGAGWKKAAVEPAADGAPAEVGEARRARRPTRPRPPDGGEGGDPRAPAAADDRARLVDALLARARFVTHQTTVWRNLLLPEANANFAVRFSVPG